MSSCSRCQQSSCIPAAAGPPRRAAMTAALSAARRAFFRAALCTTHRRFWCTSQPLGSAFLWKACPAGGTWLQGMPPHAVLAASQRSCEAQLFPAVHLPGCCGKHDKSCALVNRQQDECLVRTLTTGCTCRGRAPHPLPRCPWRHCRRAACWLRPPCSPGPADAQATGQNISRHSATRTAEHGAD